MILWYKKVTILPLRKYEWGMALKYYSVLKLESHYQVQVISFIFLSINAIWRVSFCHTWDWELVSQIVCNLRHSGKFMIHVLIEKARGDKNK